MKKILPLIILVCISQLMYAQQTVDAIRTQAMTSAQQQDFSGAIQTLQQGLQQYPDNLDLLKDEAYIAYLGRDYQHALETGKTITERDDADIQSYQILGLTYKAIADYKNADKLYKTALKKFPQSGVLYGEYGDMLAQYDNKHGAIVQWEKGIAAEANYSSNYYYAAKYYSNTGNILWAVLYGETFINIESLSKRTVEIKDLLLTDYKKLFEGNVLSEIIQKGTPFEKAVAATFTKQSSITAMGLSPESLTALRTRFILFWDEKNAEKFPFRLFQFQLQLLQEGMFDAYNQWIFGAAASSNDYDTWVHLHGDEVADLQNFQRNVLYKIPEGQYYMH